MLTKQLHKASPCNRQLTVARDRIATGLKKILETNELVVNMEVSGVLMCLLIIAT